MRIIYGGQTAQYYNSTLNDLEKSRLLRFENLYFVRALRKAICDCIFFSFSFNSFCKVCIRQLEQDVCIVLVVSHCQTLIGTVTTCYY